MYTKYLGKYCSRSTIKILQDRVRTKYWYLATCVGTFLVTGSLEGIRHDIGAKGQAL